jgi:putative transposase
VHCVRKPSCGSSQQASVHKQAIKRYGYTAAHRCGDVSRYSTNLTEPEWELVADLFERVSGQRGTPPHYSRRELVNARSYVLRTGGAW